MLYNLPMQKTCKECQLTFEITNSDLEFYEKLSPVILGKTYPLQLPTHCPQCRQQRRVAQGNQLHLYQRRCDLTGAMMISNFHESAPYKVYAQKEWHEGKWDAFQYGKNFDFTRSFFDQFADLSLTVPRPAMHRAFQYDENADYTNYAGKNKNCYLIFDSDENRDCYFSYSINSSESCVDCYRARACELCSDCIDCENCYNSNFLQDCNNCSESMFLKNCIGCMHCIMCSNLNNKEYFVENKQVTKEQFQKLRVQFTSHQSVQSAKKRFDLLKLEFPQKYMHGIQNENVIGDYLTHSKNAESCFDSSKLWDCRYVYQAFNELKDCMDVQECGNAERLYECAFSGYNAQNMVGCSHCLDEVSDLYYCMNCPRSKNLFGCAGMIHQQYCILNKQYTKEEYEKLIPRVVNHMQESGEWGEYFPIKIALYPYNTTLAQEYFPITQAAAEAKGWRWQPEEIKSSLSSTMIPDDILTTDANICNIELKCEATGKPFKIIPQEFKLRRQMGLALPRTTFFYRNDERRKLRNPRILLDRNCAKCQKLIRTTYATDRPEIVYCEECYLKEVY